MREVDCTRRRFLIGTTAALALAALPAWSLSRGVLPAMPPGATYRLIYMLRFSVEWEELMDDAPVVVKMGRASSPWNILQFAINPRGFLQWHAAPGDEVVLLGKHALRLDVAPPIDTARIDLRWYEEGDDVPWEMVLRWHGGVPHQLDPASHVEGSRRDESADHALWLSESAERSKWT